LPSQDRKAELTQKFEDHVRNLETHAVHASTEEFSSGPDLIAIGLLKLQQRFEALDKLYNEEIGRLSQDLAQMKADYVRLYQAMSVSPHTARPSRRSGGRAKSKV
jgi:exonuclease VII small subunit